MVTRGLKRTPYQDPRVTIGPATVVIIPEYKIAEPGDRQARAEAVHRARAPQRTRRAGPEAQLALEAQLHPRLHPGDRGRRRRGADARPTRRSSRPATRRISSSCAAASCGPRAAMYCLGGITRGNILRVAREAGIPAFERDFSLVDVYGADEAFFTGTFAGVTPVRVVDGRAIGFRSAPPADGSAPARSRGASVNCTRRWPARGDAAMTSASTTTSPGSPCGRARATSRPR